jgi:hypothetical protein
MIPKGGRVMVKLYTACVAIALMMSTPAHADDITDAMEQARKSYAAGDMAGAKQSLDLASQLIGQKNAESFGSLLPAALAGWKADDVQTTALGQVGFGVSAASRRYENAKGDNVEVQITGDSAMIMQFATLMSNPGIAGAMGKIIKVGDQRAIQTREGDVHIVVANKFLVMVNGSADAPSKLAYAQAVNFAKLAKM